MVIKEKKIFPCSKNITLTKKNLRNESKLLLKLLKGGIDICWSASYLFWVINVI